MDTINPRLIKIQRLYNKIVSSTQEDIDRRLSVMYMLERMDHEASNVTIHPRVLTAHKVIDRSLTEAKVEHQTYRFQNQDLSGVTLVLQNLRFKDSDDTTTGVIHLFSNGKFTYVQFGVFYALPSVLTAHPFNKNPIPKLNRILEKHGLDLAVVHKGKTVKVAINGLIASEEVMNGTRYIDLKVGTQPEQAEALAKRMRRNCKVEVVHVEGLYTLICSDKEK